MMVRRDFTSSSHWEFYLIDFLLFQGLASRDTDLFCFLFSEEMSGVNLEGAGEHCGDGMMFCEHF